ncbi:hypothetical protein [Flavihumibacter petaseus]|uniref:Uncharacterized protein n=1 Tax=Flavihumibacter petaseus NBRC 106054 TaxID=1220578 RepID=A0A0E9N4A1_9BACT|nr:hypothetical protein [Flavihumibacter petaseus]GAO44807.1 hypothetical protein FPE01S_04_00500 [Flavihumibacter petaseus NBRC 106054]
MKNSNRILIGFVLFIVLVPLMMLAGFISKIKSNNFTTENFNNPKREVTKLEPANYVVVKSYREGTCNIGYAAQPQYYQYYQAPGDTLDIHRAGDTLVFEWKHKPGTPEVDNGEGVSMDIDLPLVSLLVADGLTISVDSLSPEKPSDILLQHDAGLVLGNEYDHETIAKYGQVKVTARNSKVKIQSKSEIAGLQLNLEGESAVEIDPKATVGEVSGTISEMTVVNAPYRIISRLKPAVVQ